MCSSVKDVQNICTISVAEARYNIAMTASASFVSSSITTTSSSSIARAIYLYWEMESHVDAIKSFPLLLFSYTPNITMTGDYKIWLEQTIYHIDFFTINESYDSLKIQVLIMSYEQMHLEIEYCKPVTSLNYGRYLGIGTIVYMVIL